MQKQAYQHIIIAGHADDTGDEKKNMTLSRQRAESVIIFLEKNMQIPAGKIKPEVYGSSKPAVENNNAGNRALNRRVEITVR